MGKGPKKNSTDHPSCARCTALVRAGVERCSMCGWPSHVGFPPIDGELEQTTTAAPEAESADEAVDEHVGAQLDALTTLAERSLPVADPVEAPAEAVATDVMDAVEVAEPETVETAAPQQVPELVLAGGVLTITSAAPPDLDPLTAPFEQVSGPDELADEDLQQVVLPPPLVGSDVPADADGSALAEPMTDEVLETTPAESPEMPKPTGIARIVSILLIAVGLVGLVNGALAMATNPEQATATDLVPALAVLGVALVGLGLWVACAVTFLVWLSRARTYSDTYSAVTPRHSRTFAIWCWLIPVAGFFFGWRVLQDLWTASDPASRMNVSAKPAEPGVISLWLGALVGSSVISLAGPSLMGGMPILDVVSAALLLVSAVALARIVTTVAGWQQSEVVAETPSLVAPEATA